MHPKSMKFRPGDRWVECPVCGFDFLKSQLVQDPNTKELVCKKCVDPKDREVKK